MFAEFCLCILSGGGDEPRVVRVEAFPPEIRLESRFAYAQLVLTGVRDDGSRIDVTRQAKPVGTDGLVTLSEHGLVRPASDGDGQLRLLVDELEFTVPVSVHWLAEPFAPGFVRDVMPVLSRLGCNAGTCHGSQQGKNGFKLSLRGYDAEADWLALTDDLAGRRFDRAVPAASLFLQKPTQSVPHEGGLRLERGSRDYELLCRWVEDGVGFDRGAARVVSIALHPENPTVPEPGMAQQFAVLATYSDGSVRDVTAHAFVESADTEILKAEPGGLVTTLRRGDAAVLARYEGAYAATRLFVMGDRSGFEWTDVPEFLWIDTLVYERLRRTKTLPSELCTDAEFLRRVHLDLTGMPPTRRDVTTFLLDTRDSRTKRDEVVDRLVGSPAFVEHWTNRHADLLQVNATYLGEAGARAVREWIRGAIASNLPYNEFVRQLLTASGSTLQNPPAAYYKVQREPGQAIETTTQLFLGIRFNCNKCHDHPFERWTQRQHWQLASFLAQVVREDAPGSQKMPGSTTMAEGERPPAYEEIVSDGTTGDAKDLDGKSYAPAFPFAHDGAIDADAPRRVRLAQWLAAPENPYFARSFANRVWSWLLGSGLIEPVDDIRAGNPPTNPELLDRLTDEFVAHGFDVRWLVRTICKSRVYQHSIRTNAWNQDDEVGFSHAKARRLPAEALYDAVHQATGAKPRLPGVRAGTRAGELVDGSVDAHDGFLGLFGRPPRESACECERSSGMSLGQALNLVNGETLAAAVHDPNNDIAELVRHERDARAVVRELYLRFLCREPGDDELEALVPGFDPGDLANTAALSKADADELARRRQAWEAAVPVAQWQPLTPSDWRSDGGATLALQDDGSLLASGTSPERDRYTVVASTDLRGITGIRLEAMTDERLPSQGPGRAPNGNFVLDRFAVTAVPLADPAAAKPVVLGPASADFSQGGFAVAQLTAAPPKGWAISPRGGKPHEAVVETEGDIGQDGGTLFVFTLGHGYGGQHVLGRFRLSVTTSKRPVRHHGLPDDIAAILAVPRDERSDEQERALFRHWIGTDPQMAERIRLGAAQDLAWALATSPAFLFNR